MSKRSYYITLSVVFFIAMIMIYVYLRQYPSLIFLEDLNAYVFTRILLNDYPFALIIFGHPIFIITICFVEDKKGSIHKEIQKRFSWIFMAVLVMVLLWGFIFYGLRWSNSIPEFYTYFESDFIFGGLYSPILYLVFLYSLAIVLSSFYIDLYFVVRKVTRTWWLQVPLIIVLVLTITWLIPHLINTVNPKYPEQIMFVVPSLHRPIWFHYCYFFIVKAISYYIIKKPNIKFVEQK